MAPYRAVAASSNFGYFLISRHFITVKLTIVSEVRACVAAARLGAIIEVPVKLISDES